MKTMKEIMIKCGIREGFREGTSKLADRPCYGYDKSDDGKLIVNEAEAKIVRWIFERYISGDSLGKIVDGLAAKCIPSPTGNSNWSRQAIDKLLANEKYAGCTLLQKTITEDGRQILNNGQINRYLYQDSHPAVVSIETFKTVQEEKRNRSRSFEKAAVHEWVMSM